MTTRNRMAVRRIVVSLGVGFVTMLWLSATPVIAEEPTKVDEIPPEILEFIAEGEKARAKRIEELRYYRAHIDAKDAREAREIQRDLDGRLALERKPKGPFAPYLPPTFKVGDRGQFWYQFVTVAQVVGEDEMLVKVPNIKVQDVKVPPEAKWKYTTICLRGFPTKDVADGQNWKIEAPLEVTGTADVKDGSRRKLLVVEPLDMTPYEEHWEAAIKQLKKKRGR